MVMFDSLDDFRLADIRKNIRRLSSRILYETFQWRDRRRDSWGKLR